MLLINDVAAENPENTLDLVQESNWFGCQVGNVNINRTGLLTDLEREGVWSGFTTWVAEIPTWQAHLAGLYITSLKSKAQGEITLPVYGVKEYQWSSNELGYAVGTTYPVSAEITIANAGAINFVSVGGGIFSIGCRFTVVSDEIQLPESLERRLEKLGRLPEKWDSYSASRISGKAIEKAKSVLINARIHCGVGLLEEVFIAPCSDGGIQLEWTSESEIELVVKIPPSSKRSTFLLTEPSGKEKEGTIRDPEDWNRLLDEFCEPKV
jgi:hypothetical protein